MADRDETLIELESPPQTKPKPNRDHALQIYRDEIRTLIANRLADGPASETEMWTALDGAPQDVVWDICDRLGVRSQSGFWRLPTHRSRKNVAPGRSASAAS